jgi:hypothetical protein
MSYLQASGSNAAAMYVDAPCSWVRIVTEETMAISVIHGFLNGPLTHLIILRCHVLPEVSVDTCGRQLNFMERTIYGTPPTWSENERMPFDLSLSARASEKSIFAVFDWA